MHRRREQAHQRDEQGPHPRNPNYAPAHITGSSEESLEGEGIRIVALAPGQALRVECEAILVITHHGRNG